MSKLRPLKPEQVIQKLKKLGFIGPIPGGKHVRMVHPQQKKIIPIPIHKFSIPSNIAEGAARNSRREFNQFLYVWHLGLLLNLKRRLSSRKDSAISRTMI